MAGELLTTARNFAEDEEVVVKINGEELRYWQNMKMRFAVDAVSTFSFSAPFDPSFPIHRKMFRPLQYQTVEITVGGKLWLTGTVLEIAPQGTSSETTVTVSGYGKPGVLADCTLPRDATRQFNNARLATIAELLAANFGLKTFVLLPDDKYQKQFKKVACEPDQIVHEFLLDLVKQRSGLMTDNEEGELVIWVPQRSGSPVARLVGPAVTTMTVQTNAQEYFTDMVGISGTKRRRKGDLAKYVNPLLTDGIKDGLVRPQGFRIADSDKGEAYTVAKGRIGRMFANAATWKLPNIASWKDPSGNFWERNTTIKVQADNLMIYRETEFLIRAVEFDANEQARSTTLELVLPEVFADEATPEFWPWDDTGVGAPTDLGY